MSQSRKPLMIIEHIQSLHTSSDAELIEDILSKGAVLFIALHGCGALRLNGQQSHALERGQAYAIVPGMKARFEHGEGQAGARGCFIGLSCYETNDDEAAAGDRKLQSAPWPFPAVGKLEGAGAMDWLQLAEQLLHAAEAEGLRSLVQMELLRGKLLLLLLECSEASLTCHWQEPVIQRSIAYMEQHYRESADRSKLAALAGMSVWQYSDLFKKETGQSPMAYLNGIRLRRAKEELLGTDLAVAEIAKHSGFSDEYYFSRKFKKSEGVSPIGYRRLKRNKIAAASFPYTGQLLALNVIPYVAVVDKARDSHRSSYFNAIPFQLQRDEQMGDAVMSHNLALLQEARPELVMCSETEAESYRAICEPNSNLVVIPWMELDWRQQLCRIADSLGKRKDAETWLRDYDCKAERAARIIRGRIGNAALSIVQVKPSELLVYGGRNGGSVLFQDLGLQPAYPFNQIPVSHAIRPEELGRFAGEHLLVIVDKDAASRAFWNECRQAGLWNKLIPFERRQVYEVNEMPWLDYSAHGHSLIVDEALRLFG
ncbi:AraC family transcriptional regulator [Paenibacillus sp. HB172176]|uniref:AraC family transcriptional regulator n=1 Tax=Paenibacillus sp. HB172176 TaxID=2493690 RepID=UPI00143C89A9|nr:AraC family transcriptional regulator [Paenibacillus sp. HB172176]